MSSSPAPKTFSTALNEWLKTPEAAHIMDQLAHSVLDTVRSRKLPISFINRDPYGSRTDSDLRQDIRSELTVFLLENVNRLRVHFAANPLAFPWLLKQRFISHWLSRSRNPATDPFRYLYKRTQDLLREEPGFFTLAKKGRFTAYSMMHQNSPIPPLAQEDFQSIPFPLAYSGHSGDHTALKTKTAILGLAGYFWKQVHGLWGEKAVWVDIRDFLCWVALHVPLKQVSGEAASFTEAREPAPYGQKSVSPDEIMWDPDAVRSWAKQFYRQTDPEKLSVFRLVHQEELTLREIAQRLGYKGSSGPKYVLDQIASELQFFLRDLPWLSPEDLNPEAFSLFFDTLFALLKKNTSKP